MKVNNSNLLPFLAGVVGVTGIGLLINLPAGAQDKLNPEPSIFAETTYNRSQRVLTNTQYAPSEPTFDAQKQNSKKKKTQPTAQNTTPGAKLNPAPSILQECPYNRSACPGGGGSTPTSPTTRPAPVPGGEVTPPTTQPAPTEPSTTPTTPEPGTTPTKPPTAPSRPTPGTTPGGRSDSNKNIVAIAAANGSFKTLTKALQVAGLSETLQGKGPFTVFAPTDEAFAKLPPDALRDLLKPENKEVLVKILTYHVVSGRVLSTDLKSGQVKSLQGDPIGVKVDPSTGVTVNDAKVVQPDIKASNGVIHVINQVILPPTL